MSAEMGLRERKRLAAMRRIQEVALDLFDDRGFEAVTIEEVAAAAEVSPSSIYRYFGTKEQLVLWDEVDVRFLDVIGDLLAQEEPVEAVRKALSAVTAQFFGREEALARRKMRYWMDEPALQLVASRETDNFVAVVAAGLAEAAGRPREDLDVQVVAATLVWGLVAAARHWYRTGLATPLEDELARALDVMEHGLRLD